MKTFLEFLEDKGFVLEGKTTLVAKTEDMLLKPKKEKQSRHDGKEGKKE